jgi:hypothetical protein
MEVSIHLRPRSMHKYTRFGFQDTLRSFIKWENVKGRGKLESLSLSDKVVIFEA